MMTLKEYNNALHNRDMLLTTKQPRTILKYIK